MPGQSNQNVRAAMRVTNKGDTPLTLILEPWATEYQVPPGSSRDVVETGGAPQEIIELQVSGTVMTFFARTGAVMSVVANGVELP
jgi:hypothetical protein